jgi:DNA-3-methyladenine glycosylase I
MSDTMFCPKCGSKVLADHRFCASCGGRLDFAFLHHEPPRGPKPPRKQINYIDLFQKVEATIKKQSTLTGEDFEKHFGRFKSFDYRKDTNEEIHWKLVQAVFYSGMKAGVVTAKLPRIKEYLYDYKTVMDYTENDISKMLADSSLIRNDRKIRGCVKNAQRFDGIVKKHGSFAKYIESFGNLDQAQTLQEIRNNLMDFDFLGEKTAYHLMLDMGLKVWKPDRVICRILCRLGLISNIKDSEEAVQVGREMADHIGLPIRYVDIIFVKYGQLGPEEPFGLDSGICLRKNPRCTICGIKEYCVRGPDSCLEM